MTSGQETWAWLIGLFLIGVLIGDKIARYVPFIVLFLFAVASAGKMLSDRKKYKQSDAKKRNDIKAVILNFSFFFLLYYLYFHVLT